MHRSTVSIVRVTRDFVHVARHVVDDRHHVPGRFLSDQPAGYVQGYGRRRGAHGDAQNRHAAALHYQVYRMYRRGLNI